MVVAVNLFESDTFRVDTERSPLDVRVAQEFAKDLDDERVLRLCLKEILCDRCCDGGGIGRGHGDLAQYPVRFKPHMKLVILVWTG